MKIYKTIEEFVPIDNAVVTIGTFDGVHVGHQKILDVVKECAEKINGETVLLTFFPHPRMVLHPGDDNLRLINTIEEKIRRLAKCKVDHLIITPFTQEFSQQSPEEYIRDILVNKIGTKKIVIGYDHRFGINRSGSLKDLLDFAPVFGYDVKEIAEQDINDVAVSSTKIREALIKGEINIANQYLGYPFELTGKVVQGDQIGRNIGFPTANINIAESYKLIPAYGIYAVEVAIAPDEQINVTEYIIDNDETLYKGMGYIGMRPTLQGNARTIEVNLFDFNDDLYGKRLRIKIREFIRHDVRYDNIEAMKNQIANDEIKIRTFFDQT